jgi:hypothetical protein
MPDFGIMRGFNEKLFGDKLVAGQLPTQLGLIGSETIGFVGLLDIYANAAAAYSVRKLRADYIGSAIRVRRSDSTESDIGFTSAGNLDTTALLAFTGTSALDNGFVTTWYDQSGNANNQIQTTAINQPKIVDSGTVILQGGNPSILFDGSNDFFEKTNYDFNTSNFTAISIVRLNSIASQAIFDADDFTRIAQLTQITGGNARVLSFSNSGNTSDSINVSNNTNYLFFAYNNNTTLEIYANNITNGGATSIAQITGTVPLRIGSTIFGLIPFSGYGQEFLLYQSDQSPNRTGIESNINTYYAIY